MQFWSGRRLIVWLFGNCHTRLASWAGLAVTPAWYRTSWFATPDSCHSILLHCFIPDYPLALFFSHPSCYVFPSLSGHWKKARAISLLSVWGRTGIYPVSWCEMNSATWAHKAQYRSTFGDGRWHGGGRERERVCACTHKTACHTGWHKNIL